MLFILSLICLFVQDGKIATEENSISTLPSTVATILDRLPDFGVEQEQIDYEKNIPVHMYRTLCDVPFTGFTRKLRTAGKNCVQAV